MIEIYPSTDGLTILGETFFTQYAVQFDYDKSTIGFAVNSNTDPGVLLTTSGLAWWAILLIALGGVIVLGAAIFGILKCRKKNE